MLHNKRMHVPISANTQSQHDKAMHATCEAHACHGWCWMISRTRIKERRNGFELQRS